jgi:hypothetical protein
MRRLNMRHRMIALPASLLMFRSSPVCAQPLTNPAFFGRGPGWLGLVGILFFTTPLVWIFLAKFGYFLSGKTNKLSWKRLWRDYFVIIGTLAWIVLVIVFFVA